MIRQSIFLFRSRSPHSCNKDSLEPERVIYIGTFSKILSLALRLGYIVLPPPLTQRCRSLKRLTDLHSPSLEQLILCHFIEGGHLERHIASMKKIYRKRRETLIHALASSFPNQVHISGDATGLHLIAEFAKQEFSEQTIENAERAGVHIYLVETPRHKQRPSSK